MDEANVRGANRRLSAATVQAAARQLANRDRDLARIVERHGYPPMWGRPPGFATLVWIILEQQVSIASARTLFHRLRVALGGQVTPAAVTHVPGQQLRHHGRPQGHGGRGDTGPRGVGAEDLLDDERADGHGRAERGSTDDLADEEDAQGVLLDLGPFDRGDASGHVAVRRKVTATGRWSESSAQSS